MTDSSAVRQAQPQARAHARAPAKDPARTKSPPIDVPVLRRAAMDFLARREHSFYELSQKLCRKFPDAELGKIEAVLCRLREQRLQSDERFTEAYVRYRKTRGFAYLHIKADLAQRKVPLPVINAYLYEDDAEWTLIALSLVHKRTSDDETIEFGSKQHRKLHRLLKSRGFTPTDTRKVLQLKLA